MFVLLVSQQQPSQMQEKGPEMLLYIKASFVTVSFGIENIHQRH